MIHEVEVSNLMFNKTTDEPMEFNKYDINIELEEESSNDQKTVLKYSIDLTSNPKNSVINISGNTILSGEQSEIEEFLKQEDQKTPQVVSLIYQELFPLMYIISKNMKIPAPAHTISQNQILDSNIKEDIEKNMDKISSEIKNSTDEEQKSENSQEESIPESTEEEPTMAENSIKEDNT